MPAIVVAAAAAAAALPSGETTRLKHLQNRIIGNSTEKARLAANDAAVSDIVDDLNDESHNNTELRIASANIIASLATGSDVALKSLLHAKAHQALLYAISRMTPITEPRLRIAFARALKAVGTAVADAVGPSWWALGPDTIPGRDAARVALEECLNEAAQDVYLPLLVDDCTAVVTAICDMLGQMLRVKVHRLTVSDWLPPADREHEHKRVKRGWERTDVQPHAPRRNGGWVTRQLVTLLSTKDIKLLEATLFALAAVSKDNLPVAKALTVLPHPEAEPIVGIVMQLARSRYVDIQVAACFCAAQIFAAMNSVAHPIVPHPQLNPTPQAYSLSEAQLTLVHVLNQAISSPEFKPLARGRACFTLALLVSGEPQLAQMVAECGSVGVLAAATVAATPSGIDMEEESKEAAFFREGLLTAAAALTLPSESNRQKLGTNADFATALAAALRHPAPGVRHAACLCLRGITRSVHALRTAVLDADLGPRLFEIVCREHEDRRVQIASLAAMCNLISMEHSPARFELLQRGGIDRLVEFIRSSEDAMRVNAAWAIANCLHKATAKEKRIVITKLGWDTLRSLLSSANEDLREQAVAILINYSSTQAGDAVDHIGQDNLVSTLDTVLSSRSSGLVCRGIEAMLVLMNGAPGPALLTRVRDLLGHKDVAVRRAAAKSVSDLLELNGGLYSAIKDAGIESTLKAMHGPSHIGQQNLHLAALQWQPGMEEDAEVRRQVSMALQHLENYSSDDDLDAAMMDRS